MEQGSLNPEVWTGGRLYLISGLICLIGNCPWGKVLAVGQVRILVA